MNLPLIPESPFNVTLCNFSPDPRRHWTIVTFPRQVVERFGTECSLELEGKTFRAVRGQTIGDHASYHVRAELDGREMARGKLVDVRHADATHHTMHKWALDDITKLMPKVGVVSLGLGSESTNTNWDIEFSSEAVIVFHLKDTGNNGIVFEVWASIFHDDPVIDLYGKVTWSDRDSREVAKTFDRIELNCGERLVFDYAKRHGIIGGAKGPDGVYHYILGHNITLKDGAPLIFTAAMQCFRDLPDSFSIQQSEEAIRDIRAAEGGPTFAVSHAFGGNRWLASEKLPNMNRQWAERGASEAVAEFESKMQATVGWFAPRKLGCALNPGQTGDQEDFAATKGTFAVVAHDPRWIYLSRYAAQAEGFRGGNHYEANGDMVLAANHPDWVTYNGITHSTGRDRLGKDLEIAPANGWRGYDHQHRSQNNLAAYLALSMDPALLSHCRFMLEVDRADYRRRFPNGAVEATRGQGRPMQAWANLHCVTGERGWMDLIEAHAAQSMRAVSTESRPMRPLGWAAADSRKPVFLNGVLAPFVSLWEHGLAVVALKAASTRPLRLNTKVDDALLAASMLLMDWAIVKDEQGARMIVDMAWNNGESIPTERGSQAIVEGYLTGTGWWVFAGLCIARDVARSTGAHWNQQAVDEFVDARLREIGDTSIFAAEWLATLPLAE